ncbi:hypothetical protein BH23BAC1_BH23BAC1_33730 [soil metagenome]
MIINNTILNPDMKNLISLLLIILAFPVQSFSQDHKSYTASFVAQWANDTASIETFTIIGNHVFGRAIHLFPEPHLRQFTFWFNDDGSMKALDMQLYQLQNTSLPLESKTGLPTRLFMNFSDDTIDFKYVNMEEERSYIHSAPRMNFFGGWIPIMAQFEWLSRVFNDKKAEKMDDLRFVNYVLGVYDLELTRLNEKAIQFKSNIMEPVKIQHDQAGIIEFVDAVGSGWNFKIYKSEPIDIELYTKHFSKKPVLGDPSPHQVVSKKIGDATIEIDYGRPQKRGREIFGNIVPFNTVWRTGAGRPTTIKFDKDLNFKGEVIPKGKYNLYTRPDKEFWTLIFNTEENAWGSAYKKEFDFKHVKIPSNKSSDITDQFTIDIEEKGKEGLLKFMWDDTVASVNFKVLK